MCTRYDICFSKDNFDSTVKKFGKKTFYGEATFSKSRSCQKMVKKTIKSN